MSDRDVDVLVIGAGLAGISAAWHVIHDRPGTTFAIVEARDDLGGTWDLFRFPGVRSDSDMHTMSFPYRPWQGSGSRADGARILSYLRESAVAYGIDQRIRFGRRVTRASWSSDNARWTVEVRVGDLRETWTCSFLYACTGYYDYAAGYTPDFAGVDDFRGQVVHPQLWPETLEVRGKRVVVVGSGATAVTLVPALADAGADVTMVQRSPSWVMGVDGGDPVGTQLRHWLPGGLAARISRTQNAAMMIGFYALTRHAPRLAAAHLRRGMRAVVGDEVVAQHFTPHYAPWDQRLCIAPGHDFLHTVADGRARLVTDRIARFVPDGLELASGEVVAADIVVTATGLNLLSLGGIELVVDGREVDLADTFVYRGAMLSGVPNLAFCMGYFNASWTLRAEVTNEFVMRVLAHLQEHDAESATPVAPTGMPPRPILEMSAGYVLRGRDQFPKQGDRPPWTIRQNWFVDRRQVRRARVEEDMTFVARRPRPAVRSVPEPLEQAS